MQENYLISILGRQNVDGESGEIELTTLGSYTKKNGSRFISYKEYDPDNMTKSHTAILKIEDGEKVTLMRGGTAGTRLILENGKRHLCRYDTGCGHLMVGVFTNRFHSTLTDGGGHLEVGYTLDINSSLSSLNQISITVKEAGKNNVKACVKGDR